MVSAWSVRLREWGVLTKSFATCVVSVYSRRTASEFHAALVDLKVDYYVIQNGYCLNPHM